MYSNLNDNQLIALHKEGDINAFEEISKRYKGMILSFSRSYFLIGGDGDDLFQEGFLGLFKAVNTYDETQGTSFKTFAYTCISNNIKTAVTKSQNKTNSPLNNAIPLENLSAVALSSPEETVIKSEDQKEFDKKLKGILSPLELKILKMWLDGLSYKQISESLGKEVKSVDNAIQRIKKKLTV